MADREDSINIDTNINYTSTVQRCMHRRRTRRCPYNYGFVRCQIFQYKGLVRFFSLPFWPWDSSAKKPLTFDNKMAGFVIIWKEIVKRCMQCFDSILHWRSASSEQSNKTTPLFMYLWTTQKLYHGSTPQPKRLEFPLNDHSNRVEFTHSACAQYVICVVMVSPMQ